MSAVSWPEEPFWDFSLRVYARPGVEAACLALQEQHRCDVNLLLFACWLAERGLDLDQPAVARLEAGAGRWQEEVVRPLRAVRRRLKADLESADPESVAGGFPDLVRAWRAQLKTLELDAEHLEQLALGRVAAGLTRRSDAGCALAVRNLCAVCAIAAPDLPHVRALLRAVFPGAPPAEVERALTGTAYAP